MLTRRTWLLCAATAPLAGAVGADARAGLMTGVYINSMSRLTGYLREVGATP